MNIVFHSTGTSLSDDFKSHVQEKIERSLHPFHKVFSVDFFVKVEGVKFILEVLVKAEHHERIYLHQSDTDLFRGMEKLLDRLSENVRRKKVRYSQRSYSGIKKNSFIIYHHGYEKKETEGDENTVFSSKPLPRFEAWLELRISKENILIYRESSSGNIEIMIKENGSFFLITSNKQKISSPDKKTFEQHKFVFNLNRYKVLEKKVFEVLPMSEEEAKDRLKKEDFVFFINKKNNAYSIMFRYSKNRIGFVENILL